METFGINEAQMGAVFTGALIVGAVLFPLWGYLYDRYARAKLLALASFIWGSTTWLSAVAPGHPSLLATRAGVGIVIEPWRGVFIVTGALGIVISILILLGVREAPRGKSEPEMAGL